WYNAEISNHRTTRQRWSLSTCTTSRYPIHGSSSENPDGRSHLWTRGRPWAGGRIMPGRIKKHLGRCGGAAQSAASMKRNKGETGPTLRVRCETKKPKPATDLTFVLPKPTTWIEYLGFQ